MDNLVILVGVVRVLQQKSEDMKKHLAWGGNIYVEMKVDTVHVARTEKLAVVNSHTRDRFR